MARRIAIIPARGGSKRIPLKNVRPFGGKPMIGHVLDTARTSGLFDVIHVSTESDVVRSAVEGLGFSIAFPRPASLADDFTPIVPVLRYVVETYASRGQTFDEVWLLMACAPFIEPSDLVAAAQLAAEWGGQRPVIAVAPYPVPIEWAFSRKADGSLVPVQPGMFAVRSQDLEPRYYDTGTFLMFPTEQLLAAEGAGSDANYVGYPLGKDKAIDIDDEADWQLAEAMYTSRGR